MLVRRVANNGWVPLLWHLIVALGLWDANQILDNREMSLSKEDVEGLNCSDLVSIKGLVQLKNFNWRTQLREPSCEGSVRGKKRSKNTKDLILALFAYEIGLIQCDQIISLNESMTKGNFFSLFDHTLQNASLVFLEVVVALIQKRQKSADDKAGKQAGEQASTAQPVAIAGVGVAETICDDNVGPACTTNVALVASTDADEEHAYEEGLTEEAIRQGILALSRSSMLQSDVNKHQMSNATFPDTSQIMSRTSISGQEKRSGSVLSYEPKISEAKIVRDEDDEAKQLVFETDLRVKKLFKADFIVPEAMKRPESAFCFFPNPIGYFIMLGLYEVQLEVIDDITAQSNGTENVNSTTRDELAAAVKQENPQRRKATVAKAKVLASQSALINKVSTLPTSASLESIVRDNITVPASFQPVPAVKQATSSKLVNVGGKAVKATRTIKDPPPVLKRKRQYGGYEKGTYAKEYHTSTSRRQTTTTDRDTTKEEVSELQDSLTTAITKRREPKRKAVKRTTPSVEISSDISTTEVKANSSDPASSINPVVVSDDNYDEADKPTSDPITADTTQPDSTKFKCIDRLKCDFLTHPALVLPCITIMKQALLAAAKALYPGEADDAKRLPDLQTLDANLIQMLFIDLVLIQLPTVSDAIHRNITRTNEGRLWPLYVDPQTYAILLRCILYGESVADQGYTWREVFAHYRPVIEQRPQLGMFKPERNKYNHMPNVRRKKNDSGKLDDDSPEWLSVAMETLIKDASSILNNVMKPVATTIINATVSTTNLKRALVSRTPKSTASAVTKPAATTTVKKGRQQGDRAPKQPKVARTSLRRGPRKVRETAEVKALRNRIDCRYQFKSHIASHMPVDPTEATEEQLENEFAPLIDDDMTAGEERDIEGEEGWHDEYVGDEDVLDTLLETVCDDVEENHYMPADSETGLLGEGDWRFGTIEGMEGSSYHGIVDTTIMDVTAMDIISSSDSSHEILLAVSDAVDTTAIASHPTVTEDENVDGLGDENADDDEGERPLEDIASSMIRAAVTDRKRTPSQVSAEIARAASLYVGAIEVFTPYSPPSLRPRTDRYEIARKKARATIAKDYTSVMQNKFKALGRKK